MREYKLILVLKSALKDTERKKLLDSVRDMLGKVKITKDEEMGQKPLSYPIRREISGVFAKLEFETETLALDFEKRLQTNDNILRHLLVRV